MTLHRTTARGILFLLLTAALLAGEARADPPKPATGDGKVPTLIFPVVGESQFSDDYGDTRAQGSHGGNDVMAPRWAPVVAAEAGTVKFWTTSARAGCMLYLYGASGTTYLYIHLNNDRGKGNDNSGGCVAGVAYAPKLRSGSMVDAGQLIGFNGNSGDAERTAPHTQFEVHPRDGASVNPYPYLRKARRLLFAADKGTTFTLALTGKVASAAGEDLQVAVDQVRQWPGGRRLSLPGQNVPVSVPATASIEGLGGAAGLEPYPVLDLLTRGLPVTVWTEPAKVTLAAQTGAKGALAASRVVVKP
jgi:hypothetical protein